MMQQQQQQQQQLHWWWWWLLCLIKKHVQSQIPLLGLSYSFLCFATQLPPSYSTVQPSSSPMYVYVYTPLLPAMFTVISTIYFRTLQQAAGPTHKITGLPPHLTLNSILYSLSLFLLFSSILTTFHFISTLFIINITKISMLILF